MKIAAKLTILLVLFTSIPVAIVGYLAYDRGQRSIHKFTVDHLTSVNNMKKTALLDWVGHKKGDLRILARRPLVSEYSMILSAMEVNSNDWNEAYLKLFDDHLKVTLEELKGYDELMILRGSDGLIMISTEKELESKYRENEPFFKNGRSDTYVQNPYFSMSQKRSLMTIGTPIKDLAGNTVAVLAGHIDLEELTRIMLRDPGMFVSNETYLVNKFNFFITETRMHPGMAMKRAINSEGVKRALKKESGIGQYLGYRNKPVFGAYTWIPEYELAMITEMDLAEAESFIIDYRNKLIVIAVFTVLVVALIGLITSRTLTTPLIKLTAGIESFGRGEREQEIDVTSRDEIGMLASAFNKMAAERSNAEDLMQQANKELKAFSYSVSHDLRAPLRAIDGFSNILVEDFAGQLDEEGTHYLDLIMKNTTRMGELIDDLLSFSRLGRQEMLTERLDMEKLTRSVFEELRSSNPDSDISLSVNHLSTTMGDPKLMRVVMTNLLGNAFKYTGPIAGASVEVGSSVEGDHTTYFVRDNGVGFEMKYVDKLFNVFQRLHSEKDFPGTGVGLALVKRIIQRHSGRVWAEGATGKGAVFYFSIPRGEGGTDER